MYVIYIYIILKYFEKGKIDKINLMRNMVGHRDKPGQMLRGKMTKED